MIKYKDDQQESEPESYAGEAPCCGNCEWFTIVNDKEQMGTCDSPLPDSMTDLGTEVCLTILMKIEEPMRREMFIMEGEHCPCYAENGSTG